MAGLNIKKLVKDWNRLKAQIDKIDGQIKKLVIEHQTISGRYAITDELKKAVLGALVILVHENTDIDTVELYSFWTSAGEIKNTINSNEIMDIDKLRSMNIWSDIGVILVDYGFTETRRRGAGNQRNIDVFKLEELTGLKLVCIDGIEPKYQREIAAIKGKRG